MNNWKRIWENRCANTQIFNENDRESVVLELKRCNGFDVMGNGLSYNAIENQYEHYKKMLSYNRKTGHKIALSSVYEVGCGSGANLYLFEKDGISCGGIDYSASLMDIARKILKTKDLICDEAIKFPTAPHYDAILSNSVFSYFEDEKYAWNVLERMYEKTEFAIGLTDLHDITKKEKYLEYRRKEIKDYDKRYANLPKLFYAKEFFEQFAEKHQMDIEFVNYEMPGYWNNPFVFYCYLYKK